MRAFLRLLGTLLVLVMAALLTYSIGFLLLFWKANGS